MRNIETRKTVLQILERVEPYALPEETLKESLNALIRPPAGQAEFDETINWLNIKGYIKVLPDDMDPDIGKWLITETGKALLRK